MEIEVRPIHNEVDYEATLAEVDALMDAAPATPEGDRLDVLVTLVESYEARHWPIDTPDPIEAIRASARLSRALRLRDRYSTKRCVRALRLHQRERRPLLHRIQRSRNALAEIARLVHRHVTGNS